MPRPKASSHRPPSEPEAAHYAHAGADLPLRPEVGTRAQFKKHKAPQTYRYDSSLSPALDGDAQNPAREQGEAAREACGKHYGHLYVTGFVIEAKARDTVEHCEAVFNGPATCVQATPDLLMGDLLNGRRSSPIFSVCGRPEIRVTEAGRAAPRAPSGKAEERRARNGAPCQVELLGLDVFDPVTMEVTHRAGADVPARFLDTDDNGWGFQLTQAFFPRTSAWENLKKALKGDYDETVWHPLAGTVSAPFPPGQHRQIAVKVMDDRDNELLVARRLEEGR